MTSFESAPNTASIVFGSPVFAAVNSPLPASSGEANTWYEALSDLWHPTNRMSIARRMTRLVVAIVVPRDIPTLQTWTISASPTYLTSPRLQWPRRRLFHLRPPQPPPRPMLDEPRALADLEFQPPPPLFMADEPPLLSWPPQPLELDLL